jgi:hypothetical protein
MPGCQPVDGGGRSGRERRRPTTLDARRSASALTAASEAATVCSQPARPAHTSAAQEPQVGPNLPIVGQPRARATGLLGKHERLHDVGARGPAESRPARAG